MQRWRTCTESIITLWLLEGIGVIHGFTKKVRILSASLFDYGLDTYVIPNLARTVKVGTVLAFCNHGTVPHTATATKVTNPQDDFSE